MPINIEIFSSTGCGKCTQAKNKLFNLVDEYKTHSFEIIEVDVLEQLDYAVKLGVLSTPAIAINGELCFTGLPSAKELRKILDKFIEVNP